MSEVHKLIPGVYSNNGIDITIERKGARAFATWTECTGAKRQEIESVVRMADNKGAVLRVSRVGRKVVFPSPLPEIMKLSLECGDKYSHKGVYDAVISKKRGLYVLFIFEQEHFIVEAYRDVEGQAIIVTKEQGIRNEFSLSPDPILEEGEV